MKKRVSDAIWLALGACFFAGYFWLAWSSNKTPDHKISQSSSAQIERKTETQHWEWGHSDPGVTIVTFLLVIVAGAQAGLFVWQLKIMKDGIEDARISADAAKATAETAKEQVAIAKMGIIDLERAYVACGPANIRTDYRAVSGKMVYKHGDPMAVTTIVHVHNYGRTGAIIRKVYGELAIDLPPGDVPVYADGNSFPTDVSIAAGAQLDLSPFEFMCDFHPKLYFWGYVEFIDIFKAKHVARFCSILVPNHTPGGKGKYNMAGGEAWRDFD